MIKNTSIITASSYLSMLFLGVAGSLIGAAARNIGLSPYEISLMITIQNLGFMISVMIAGALADTHSKPRILLVGSLILSISFITFYSTGLFSVNLMIMFMIGVGIGTYEGVTDAMLMDIHPNKESLHININHFFVTFGSILITIYLIFLQMNWRNAVIQSGIIVIGLAVLFALIKLSTKAKNAEPYLARMVILTRDKLVLVFFIVSALVVGIEAGTVGILTTFLMDERAFTQVTSKIGLVVFLLGMALGRVIIGIFAPQEKIDRVLLILFGSAVIIYSALYFFDFQALTFLVIFLSGLSISALFPLMLTKVGLVYKEMSGTVLGSIKVAIPIGGILIPFIMSNLVKYWNFKIALLIFPTTLLVAFFLIYWINSSNKKVNQVFSGD